MERRPRASRTTPTRACRSCTASGKGKPTTPNGPIRTCAGCGVRAPQADLQRFHAVAGELVAGPGPGRGVYTCRRVECFERGRARHGFARTLRQTVRVGAAVRALYT